MRLREMMASTVQILCDVLDKHGITETSLLNFVVTDGTCIVATRYSRNVAGTLNSCSLYFAAGSKFEVDGGQQQGNDACGGCGGGGGGCGSGSGSGAAAAAAAAAASPSGHAHAHIEAIQE
jgi:hypothetical protein